MLELSARNFGLLIAYIIPGFVALLGLSLVSEPVRLWLLGAGAAGPTIGGVVYLLLACVAAGMTASAVRWALVDFIHHRSGVERPAWDDSNLVERLEAYQMLIDIHYCYYQFYANSLVALLFSFAIKSAREGLALDWLQGGVLVIAIIFFMASRDALSRYYRRTSRLLGIEKGSGTSMTNGGHHDMVGAADNTKKTQETKPAPKSAPKPHAKEDSGAGPQATQRPK